MRLALKIFLFISIITIVNVAVKCILPSFWSHKNLWGKYEYFKANNNNYSTVFIGSSRIWHHVNVELFDSITSENSFNLGVNSFPAPMTFTLLEEILKSNNTVKNIFIELTPLYLDIHPKYLHTATYSEWLNFKYVNVVLGAIFNRKTLKNRYLLAYNYSTSYLQSIFNVGYMNELLINYSSLTRVSEDGYDPYPIKDFFTNKDSSEIIRKNKLANENYSIDKKNDYFYYKKLIFSIEEACEMNNVNLYYIIPPRFESYSEVLSVASVIDKKRVFNFSDPKEYPIFYTFEYLYDRGHLNYKGANIFTNKLAKEFMLRKK